MKLPYTDLAFGSYWLAFSTLTGSSFLLSQANQSAEKHYLEIPSVEPGILGKDLSTNHSLTIDLQPFTSVEQDDKLVHGSKCLCSSKYHASHFLE